MFLFHREVLDVLLDTVVLDGSVLIHPLNSVVIQIFHLCNSSWVSLGNNLSSHAHFSMSAEHRMKKVKEILQDCRLFLAVTVSISQRVLWAPWKETSFPKGKSRWGDNFRPLPFPRSQAGTGELLLFSPFVLCFLWTGSLLFLLTTLGSCPWSAVPCLPYHPEEVLLCQRIHTSTKLRSEWPEPTTREGLPVLWPIMGLRRKHLELPKWLTS